MNLLFDKIKQVLLSVLPITLLVLIFCFTLTPVPPVVLLRFLIGAFSILIGLSIFLFGIDIGITPLGNHVGSSMSKSNRLMVVVVSGLILGFFVSVAEPDLQILAAQVAAVTSGSIAGIIILVVVSIGVAALLVTGLLRIFYNFSLSLLLFILYAIILVLALFVPSEFLAVAFDASGATTGALTVPFILALALGVSSMKKDSRASENDSFGLVAVTSTGAILGVLILGLVKKITGLTGALPQSASDTEHLFGPFLRKLPHIAFESAVALLPLVFIYIIFQIIYFRFARKQFFRILKGFLYTFIGLTLFLAGVNAGFMDIGNIIGYKIAGYDSKIIIISTGFLIGLCTILAEPAVHVLTDQIETVTSGYIKRRIVLAALALGVGAAVALSVLRILIPSLQLWHYLLPGYIISILLSFFVPRLYVGIAFDAGGVASGPMTATFILAFVQGAAEFTPKADVLRDAFGMIALVAMTPIITLQILGLIVKIKSRRTVKKHE